MDEMSVSERAAHNIQTREEYEVLKKRLISLVKYHFGENSGVMCRFEGYNEYMKSAEMIVDFYYVSLRGNKLEDLFFRMGKMDLTIHYWDILWNRKMINIKFSW